MEGRGLKGNRVGTLFIAPVPDYFSGRPVDNLPPPFIILRVGAEHGRVKTIHQIDGKSVAFGCVKGSHHIDLLDFLRMCLGPRIILPGRVICLVYPGILSLKLLRELGAVTVAYRIGSPLSENADCLLDHVQIGGDGNLSFFAHLSLLFSQDVIIHHDFSVIHPLPEKRNRFFLYYQIPGYGSVRV